MTQDAPCIDVFLQPGDLFVADAGYRIRTMLGSCVSIVLWHPRARMGGMSHFLLPSRGTREPGTELDGRYGDEALQWMMQDLARSGVQPTQCQAKLFGGGNMFPGYRKAPTSVHVGQRNGEAARALLASASIPIVSEHLFGNGHRQVIFEVSTGNVWIQQIKPQSPTAASAAEPETERTLPWPGSK